MKKSFVSFHEELLLLEKYLELEELRFRGNFEYKIIIENEKEAIKIPSMIIQPFVENAIKHGLLHKKNGVKKLTLHFLIKEVLECVIIDNGIGIMASRKINEQNKVAKVSLSTNLIQDRLLLLKDYYKTDIGFHYEKVNEGTKVKIKIPYIIDHE
ncbi:LytS family sensor histidine kinase [Tenacibaculum jejuense]|uniref:hypothetical protein n=1 Tax=Tenacibaculum jejuense TaxID=584609 RepID=UPI000BA4D247|nr:hypothetical protein [Tenacibaculum jejuense]